VSPSIVASVKNQTRRRPGQQTQHPGVDHLEAVLDPARCVAVNRFAS
jgi:hypothetical protein